MPRPAKNIKNKLARKNFYRVEIERKLRNYHIFLLIIVISTHFEQYKQVFESGDESDAEWYAVVVIRQDPAMK